MSRINICLSCDDNYSIYAGVVIASILVNSKASDDLNIYILDGGISQNKKEGILSLKSIKNCEISFISINPDEFDDYLKICTHDYITIATYYRLKLASLLPDIDKVIYLDCDMVVNTSLADLFNIDMTNYIVAGVQDINSSKNSQHPNYINAGMLVVNLDLIRQDNVEEEFLRYTKENSEKITCGDQDIINTICKDKIKILDDTWNVQTSDFMNRSSFIKSPLIIHYIAKNKPWNNNSLCCFKRYYIKYLQLTPWKLSKFEIFKYKCNHIVLFFKFILHRPTFIFQKKFYQAVWSTYFQRGIN